MDLNALPNGEIKNNLTEVLVQYPSNTKLSGEDTRKLLKEILSVLEDGMKLILEKRSKLLWLSIMRRIISPSIVTISEFPGRDLRVLLVLTSAILKYGGISVEFRFNGLLQGAEIPFYQKELDEAALLFDLASYYQYCTQLFKAIQNGTVYVRIREGRLEYKYDEYTWRIAMLENARQEKWKNVLMPVGSLYVLDPNEIMIPRNVWPSMLMVLPVIGNNEPLVLPDPFREGHRYLTNYMFYKIDLMPFLSLARVYNSLIHKEMGLTVDDIVACWASISNLSEHLIIREWAAMEDLLGSGILRFPMELIQDYLPQALATIPSPFQLSLSAQIVATKFLSSMILTEEQSKAIDLRSSWLPTFLYRVGGFIITDWLTVQYAFANLLLNVSRENKIKNIKGTKFEESVRDWLHSIIPNLKKIFPPNQKLKKGEALFGEVDLSFARQNVGFIIDCKAYNTSIEFHRGDEKAVKTRWDYTEKWLAQVIKTTKKLAKHPEGNNYKIPDSIDYLVPLVVSTTVEPLFDLDDKHLVAKDIPRVCTPNELVQLLTEVPLDTIIQNDYTFKIQKT